MQDKPLTPLKAIRQHCLSCAGRPKEVRQCSSSECNLFLYRMGHNPSRTRVGPGKVGAKSIPEGILPNSTQFPDDNGAGIGLDKANWRSCNQWQMGQAGIDLETVGKIRVRRLNNKDIVITLKSES